MTEYIYRVLYKVRDEFWPVNMDPAKNTWRVINNRSYSSLPTAKGIKTSVSNNYWHKDHELKIQRFPMTQQWEDVND